MEQSLFQGALRESAEDLSDGWQQVGVGLEEYVVARPEGRFAVADHENQSSDRYLRRR